jgi:hypothetical protein
MPFFDAGSEFLGFDRQAQLWKSGAEARSCNEGWVHLSNAPGMGYALDEGRLLATRIG